MSDGLIVGYVCRPGGSGMRVALDGAVDVSVARERWRRIASLDAPTRTLLAERTRAAGITALPPNVDAPAALRDGPSCEWRTDLDGVSRRSVIAGWTGTNPQAAPSRALVMELSRMVAAAQADRHATGTR